MKRTLFTKLLCGYLVFGIIAFCILSTFTQKNMSSHMEAEEARSLYRESTLIASDYASTYYENSISLDDLQLRLQSLASYLSADIWIIDQQGNLLLNSSDSSVSQKALDQNYVKIKNFDISDFGNKYYRIGTFYHSYDEEMLSVFSPITINYKVRGYVLLHKPLSDILKNANGYTNISFYTMGIIYLCGLVLLLLFGYTFYVPLRRITKAARSYAKGDFSATIDVHRNDEMGYLANTLNYMSHELNTLEEDQRKFVSNVSHDFRSPLTSIKGYVEAMIDGTIPFEMQEKYLNIILFETERLNKLTKSLLDLNQFGRHGMMLDISDFDLNQMIRMTLQTFEGTCSKKGITFEVILTGQKLLVTGDMSKIQQVLYNLIDNAIKFSHNDSSIRIETSLKNEKVFVSVKDYGIGIPADSVKKIWERFYKTDLSRGKDKKGTGLGLSIVKEIIQAHNEHINCISTEGVGTEFIFTLPVSKKESD